MAISVDHGTEIGTRVLKTCSEHLARRTERSSSERRRLQWDYSESRATTAHAQTLQEQRAVDLAEKVMSLGGTALPPQPEAISLGQASSRTDDMQGFGPRASYMATKGGQRRLRRLSSDVYRGACMPVSYTPLLLPTIYSV